MCKSCAVGFLAVALCVVACMSANASVTEATAHKSVTDAQNSVKTVFERVRDQLKDANFVLRRVRSFKRKAQQAALKSKAAAGGNAEADTIATRINSLSDTIMSLYSSISGKLESAVTSLEKLLSEAKTLKGESETRVPPNQTPPSDYTETKKRALELSEKAVQLNASISDALRPIADVHSTANNMENPAKEVELAHLQLNAIVAVNTISTMMRDANAIIKKIEEKRDEVNDTVKDMEKLSKNAPDELRAYLNALCRNADYDLNDASDVIKNANEYKTAMLKQKGLADATLAKVKEITEIDDEDDKEEFNAAELCVTKVEKILPQLNSALQTAEISARNANNRKKELIATLSKGSSESPTEEGKLTEKTDLPEQKAEDPHEKDPTIKPTINNPDKPVQKGTVNPEKKEKASVWQSEKDIALTVSVPLLLALIACAGLY